MTFFSKNQRISSTAISMGQAVRSTLGAGQQIAGATTDLVTTKFDGIALSVASGSGKDVYVEFSGTIDPSILNLGGGYACAVGVNASGVAVRVTDGSCVSAPNYLGHCDGYGTITVAPRRADNFNVLDFGAIGDGTTDNISAIHACIFAAGIGTPTAGQFAPWTAIADVYFGPGNFYCSDSIHLFRTVHLHGSVMGRWAQGYELNGSPATSINFKRGKCGIIVEAEGDPWPGNPYPTNSQGGYSNIENISLFGGYTGADIDSNGGIPLWHASVARSLGDIVIPSYFLEYGFAYICTTAGTSGTTEPTWSTAELPGPGIPTFTAQDGTAVWTLIEAHGVVINQPVTMANVRVIGFPGNGVHIFSDGAGASSNDSYIHKCFLGYNGGSGIAIFGEDSNANGTFKLTLHHNRGYGIFDRSFLGNTHVAPESAGNGSGGYWLRTGTIVQLYSESGDGPVILEGGGNLFGGVLGDGMLSGDFYPDWEADTVYAENAVILESTSGQYWIAYVGGPSAGSRPNFTNNRGAPFGRPPATAVDLETTTNLVLEGADTTFLTWGAYSEQGLSGAPTWRANATYPAGAKVRATGTQGHVWQNQNAFAITSGISEPTWVTTTNSTTADNGHNWTENGKGLPQAVGNAFISSGGKVGILPTQHDNRTGPVGLRVYMSSSNDPTQFLALASSDDSIYGRPFKLLLDATNNRVYWAYNGTRILEMTRTGSSPEPEGSISFPNGIYVGGATDNTALSMFDSSKIRWDGGNGVGGGTHLLGATDAKRDSYLTNDTSTHVAHTYALADDLTYGAITEVNVKVIAKALSGTDGAVFLLRGTWIRKDASVTQIAAPEVIYGEPTDSTHCTAGAVGWTAALSLSGTNVLVQISTGADSEQVYWYVTREASEGARL